jgi:hypothetical protein
MHRLQRVCGYLRESPDAAIRFHTGIPNYDDHEIPKHDWMYSVYGETSEEMPSGMPTPKGKPIRTTSFVDANLMHDLTTGRSATGILHFLNQTPIDFGVLRLYCLHLYLSTTRPLLTSCSLFPVLQMSHSTDLYEVPGDDDGGYSSDDASETEVDIATRRSQHGRRVFLSPAQGD